MFCDSWRGLTAPPPIVRGCLQRLFAEDPWSLGMRNSRASTTSSQKVRVYTPVHHAVVPEERQVGRAAQLMPVPFENGFALA